jgi:hypothetical protein
MKKILLTIISILIEAVLLYYVIGVIFITMTVPGSFVIPGVISGMLITGCLGMGCINDTVFTPLIYFFLPLLLSVIIMNLFSFYKLNKNKIDIIIICLFLVVFIGRLAYSTIFYQKLPATSVHKSGFNINLCDTLIDAEVKSQCYYQKARQLQDKIYCEKTSFQKQCNKEVDSYKYDPNKCKINFSDWQICFKKASAFFSTLKGKDLSICAKDDYDCVTGVASANIIPSYCDSLTEKMNRNLCLDEVVPLTGNPDLCETRDNDYEKSDCYSKIGVMKNDLLLCKKSGFNTCYNDLAAKNNDKSICDTMLQDGIFNNPLDRNDKDKFYKICLDGVK